MTTRHELIEFIRNHFELTTGNKLTIEDVGYFDIPHIERCMNTFNRDNGTNFTMRFEIHIESADPVPAYVLDVPPVPDETVKELKKLMFVTTRDSSVTTCTCEPDRPVRVGCPVHYSFFGE